MSQRNETAPDWLKGEETPAPILARGASEPKPKKSAAASNDEKPRRSLKGLRFREDYQERFDVLTATLKHLEGKNGPDLIEEALELLFRKYDKRLAS